jgi:hypothetical protein
LNLLPGSYVPNKSIYKKEGSEILPFIFKKLNFEKKNTYLQIHPHTYKHTQSNMKCYSDDKNPNQGHLFSWRGKVFFCFPKHPGQLWVSSSFYSMGTGIFFPGDRPAGA